jgi:hypothetical protein
MTKGKPLWDPRCSDILRRNAAHYTNREITALIEAATGKRFGFFAVSRKRAALGLECPNRNDWSAPLIRWRERLSPRKAAGGNAGGPGAAEPEQAGEPDDQTRPP